MARQDFYIKKLLQDRARFADLYNAEIFHGKQILKAELLSPVSLESGIVITDRTAYGYSKRTQEKERSYKKSGVFIRYHPPG